MRQILVDHARRRETANRGRQRILLEHATNLPDGQSADLLALEHSLKELEELDGRKCQAIELRYFAGLSIKEIAEALQVSAKTVTRDLAFAEAWLYHQMRAPDTRKTSHVAQAPDPPSAIGSKASRNTAR